MFGMFDTEPKVLLVALETCYLQTVPQKAQGGVSVTGRFTVTGKLSGLNEIVAAARCNRFAGASQKKKETNRCQWAIIAGEVPTFSTPVRLRFKWIEADLRRDPDNLCAGAKFCLDALVELKRIPNDTRRWVKAIEHVFPNPDKTNPRIEVQIEEDSCP